MLDVLALMSDLALVRPVFHSERDFQLSLGWHVRDSYPHARVRLEYRPAFLDRRGYLDVWVTHPDWTAAIEPKYFARALTVAVGDEKFELLNQGAQDVSRYDFVRDIERVESVVNGQPRASGYVLALTNDSSYWRVPTVARSTIDAAFRLHEGAVLKERLQWAAHAGAGTTRGRLEGHTLRGQYNMRWTHYSRVADGPAGTFRYVLVEVFSEAT